jgi:hypothetical protein
MNRILRFACLGLLLIAVGLQVGCDDWSPDDRALVRSFAEDWLRSRDMHPTNEDGSINIVAAANIGRRTLTGRSGDDEVDAVLDAYEVVSNIHQADQLMEQGRQQGDAAAMDEAIARRPGDWTYRTSRAALALASGDTETYEEQQAQAQQIVQSQGIDPVWYHQQSIQDMGQMAGEIDTASQCEAVLRQMALHYAELFDLTDDPAYAELANSTLDQATRGCP